MPNFLKNIFKIQPRSAHPLIQENNLFFENKQWERPLDEYEFIVIDTELTGLNKKKDEIVAIGGVRIKGLTIRCDDFFYALVKPQVKLHSESTLVHRITPQELRGAEPLEVVLPRFLDFCGKAFIVGHYVRLDFEFLNREILKKYHGVLKTPYLDTMRLAMAHKEYKYGHYYDHYNIGISYNLNALSKEYNLPLFAEHNAIEDAMQTAYLFLYLVKNLQLYGVRSMDQFLRTGRNWKILL